MYFSDFVFVALNVLEHLPCDFEKRVVLHLWKLEMGHLPSLDPLPGLAIRRLHEGSKVLRAVLRVPTCQSHWLFFSIAGVSHGCWAGWTFHDFSHKNLARRTSQNLPASSKKKPKGPRKATTKDSMSSAKRGVLLMPGKRAFFCGFLWDPGILMVNPKPHSRPLY